MPEQENLVKYLDTATYRLSQAIKKAQSEIDLIREYRTRLVSDVVAGQLDVRNVDLPEVDEHLAAEFGDVDNGEDVDDAGEVEGDEDKL